MLESHMIRWSFKSSNVMFQGRVVRIAIYLHSKVLEIIDSNDSAFYLIYFKNKILGGGMVDQVKENTFLHTAFNGGLIISSEHPLFQVFLPHNSKTIIPDSNTLFTELQSHFSLQDVALAATCMDSFIEKQQLIRIIREILNHFKRNGQYHNAYQISRILLGFSPNTKAIKELTRASEFAKYRKMEEEELLLQEAVYFQNRKIKDNEIKLHEWLKQLSRHHERLLLFMDLFEVNHDFYDYQEFIHLLQNGFNTEDQYATLKYLWQCCPDHPQLREDLFQLQIRLKLYTEAISLFVNQSPLLAANQRVQIEKIIEDADSSSLTNVPNINHLISQLYLPHPDKKEKLVRMLSVTLLKKWQISQLNHWLKPVEETTPDLPILQELRQLESLSNDLDQLLKLGETYYHFGLVDQSIECFTWEAELNPNSIDPVRWLSRLYQEKGLVEEAENYRNLAILMTKKG